jgi:glycosyltransferase involved in cell wall biosynthesis
VRVEERASSARLGVAQDRLRELLEPAPQVDPLRAALVHRLPIPLIDPYAEGRVRVAGVAPPVADLPEGWGQRLRLMDAVWVPDRRRLEVLAAAGVARDRLHVLPEAVELERFSSASPLEIPEAHGTVFVAPFEWSWRAAWDSLLDAWCRAFSPDADATLVLAVWSPGRVGDDALQAQILDRLSELGHDGARMADVVILGHDLGEEVVPRLFAAADVVCAPARARGAGRVVVEALAAGRPVVAPTWEGDELLDAAVGWPVPTSVVTVSDYWSSFAPAFAGGTWTECEVDAFAEALEAAHRRPDERRRRGGDGPARVAGHDHHLVARRMMDLLDQTRPRVGRSTDATRPGVVIEGAVSGVSSLAVINRDLARALAREGTADLALVDIGPRAGTMDLGELSDTTADLLPTYPEVTIHHAHPPAFARRSPGLSVQIAHWEFGPPPAAWPDLIAENVDEVWVASTWVRDGLVSGGVDPEKAFVVPLGVDTRRFHPGVPPLDLGDSAPGFRFLFVGGMAARKGADLLAAAFANGFTAGDDVTLVIKTYDSSGPYLSDGSDKLIERLRHQPGGPRVHMLTRHMDDAEMPGLYTACDCLVHPYRGEAFGMTMLEAMACGLPVVMPEIGAARDFADASTAILVPAHTETVPAGEVAGQAMSANPVIVETDPLDLGARLRWVYENPEAARAVGAAAAAHVAAHWTWDRAAKAILDRIAALSDRRVLA